jgi:carbonic anhydrase/acetyltransferase-like protein (isoleucine patch superfamily)
VGEDVIKSFNGKTPRIAESAFVSEAAYIVGDVEIGDESSIWPGAVIRGDTGRVVIGRATAIEDNCTVHSGEPGQGDTFIGDLVNVGHGAVIHGRKIGNNVLVGINAVILHGAEIGNYCLIGAGCVVSEGMIIPDNSFVVGVPARIKGKVPEKQMRWLRDVPHEYVKLGGRYKIEGL